jgi:hypothetical protein
MATKQVFLRTTGVQVRLVDEAQPLGLRSKDPEFTEVIMATSEGKTAIQRVRTKNLRFVKKPKITLGDRHGS